MVTKNTPWHKTNNPGDPTNSKTYNPISDGDPEEVASRILSMIPSTESNAGSDHYKQSALEALVVHIGAIQKCGMKYDFYDLAVLMNSAKALEDLLERLREKAPKSSEFRSLVRVSLGKFSMTTIPM